MEHLASVSVVGILGFVTTFVSVPFLQKLSSRAGILAYPGGRRNHKQPTPVLGGVAIYVPFAMVFVLFLAAVMTGQYTGSHPEFIQMVSLFVGATWILFLGLVDDKETIGWKQKIIGQLFGVAILVMGGHSIKTATVPFLGPVDFGWFGIPLFAGAILVITNAINLVDGVDGLAGGVCFFAALTCAIISFSNGDLFSATIAATISGSLLAFLWYNFPPASIYMGDNGSLSMGFLLGTLAISGSAVYPGQRSGTLGMIIVPLMPFSIALIDVFLSVLRRWVTGRKIFLPDSDHLHHRLMEKFEKPRRVIAIFYFFSALFSAITLCLILGEQSEFSKFFVFFVGLIFVIVLAAVLKLYRIENLARAIENRPHFQFVTSYRAFMSACTCKTQDFYSLISLLESGVRELGHDEVEVLCQGRTIGLWRNARRLHPESPRVCEQVTFEKADLTVRWTMPTHESESYHKFLSVTWYAVVREVGTKAGAIAINLPQTTESFAKLTNSEALNLERH